MDTDDKPMTARMCQERHGHLGEAISRVEDKVDTVILQQKETNGRVKTLELWKAAMIGAQAAVATLIPFLTAALIKWVFG